jgi:hypothetical protein
MKIRWASSFMACLLILDCDVHAQHPDTTEPLVQIGRLAMPLTGYGSFVSGPNRYNTGRNSKQIPYGTNVALWVGAKVKDGEIFVTNGDGNYDSDTVRGRNNFRPEWYPVLEGNSKDKLVEQSMMQHEINRVVMSVFSDEEAFDGHHPLGLRVRQKIMASPNRQFTIFHFEIENVGQYDLLDKVFVGMKADIDVPEGNTMNADNDVVKLLPGTNFPVILNDGESLQSEELLGFVVLSEEISSFSTWTREDEKTLDDYIRYDFMRQGRTRLTVTEPNDYRLLISAGQYQLKKSQKLTFTVALIQGRGLAQFLRHIDHSSSFYSQVLAVNKQGKRLSQDDAQSDLQIPDQFALLPNYPNPFNPTTEIRFDIKETADLSIRIYNSLGQEIRILTSGLFGIGRYTITWDGRDFHGQQVSSGIYFSRLETSTGFAQTRKMMLLK